MKEQEKLELKNIFIELRSGNKEIIEDLYKKYNKMIYGIAFSILKNKEDSEDILQIVFSKLYTIDKEKLPQDKEASWLYTVIKNESLQFLRKKNNIVDIHDVYCLEDKNNDIENVIDKETYNKLISKLNDKEKEIVSLKIISNLTFKEIGELLGENTATVKWRYYKSIYNLRRIISNLGMFIVTFVLGIMALKKNKKIADKEIKQEISDNTTNKENASGSLREDETSKKEWDDIETDGIEIENQVQENTIVEETIIEKEENYLGYGIIGVSTIFLISTIIIILKIKKYQLNVKKKSSK